MSKIGSSFLGQHYDLADLCMLHSVFSSYRLQNGVICTRMKVDLIVIFIVLLKAIGAAILFVPLLIKRKKIPRQKFEESR